MFIEGRPVTHRRIHIEKPFCQLAVDYDHVTKESWFTG